MYIHPTSYFRLQSFSRLLSFLFLVVLFTQITAASVINQDDFPLLIPGQAIERQLNGGDTHIFQVNLAEGQYLCVAVEQRGIDIELKLANPNKQILLETDALNSTQGPEIASIIAAQAGNYHIEIVSPSKSSPRGSYEVKILTLRTATASDQLWITAQRSYLEGKKLSEQTAAEAQTQAVQKFADALRIWQVLEDRLMIAHTLYYLVSVYRDLGQTQHALVYSGYALELIRASKQAREEAEALVTLASVMSELGEPRKAATYYEQARELWRSFNDVYGETRTLTNLAVVNTQLGEVREALNNYEKALAVWQRVGNRFQAAETLIRMGLAYENLGEWQKALEKTTQAQTIYRALDNKRGEATALNNIGLVYGRLGEARKAVDYYNQSLALWRTLGNQREAANTLSNIGYAQAQQNNSTEALGSYQLSLKFWREAGDRRGEALVLQRMGVWQATLNDPKAALEYLNQALPLLHIAGDSNRESAVLISIAEVYLAQKESAKAKEFLQQALTILQTIGNRANEAQALYQLARAECNLGNLEKARQQIEAALNKAETMRIFAGSQQLRASYLASVHKYYELNLDILMRLHQANPAAGFDALAVQASERARARSLLEMLAESRANLREGVDKALLERADNLTQQLNAAAQRQLQLTSQRANDSSLRELKREISALEDDYNQVEVAIRKDNPHYDALTQPQPLNLAAIQQQLSDDSLLLEYSLGEERSWLWAITKNSLASFVLPKRTEIEQAAIQVRDLLIVRGQRQRGETVRQREVRIAQAEAQFPAVAGALSQMLLSPVTDLLADRKLIIVSDGALQFVPFAALPAPLGGEKFRVSSSEFRGEHAKLATQNSQPLIVEHEIITLPSVSTLAVMRAENANRKPAPKAIAMFADPVFTSEEARLRTKNNKPKAPLAGNEIANARGIVQEDEKSAIQLKLSGGGLVIPQLPFTRQEAEQILALAPTAENFKATGFSASRAAALNPALSEYRYLHFATHGLIDSERPSLSSLVLSLVDEAGQPQNGFLRANEIYNLKLPAELVVLSACQTGLGKEVKGEGLIGLTRGFMYAGAARVVVSLWNVNDKATAELMAKFYEKMLKEGERPAAALRSAQVEMWKQKQWQAPYYWAAFTLQGEWK